MGNGLEIVSLKELLPKARIKFELYYESERQIIIMAFIVVFGILRVGSILISLVIYYVVIHRWRYQVNLYTS